MRMLLVVSAVNSLTQRAYAELRDRGHTLAVHILSGSGSGSGSSGSSGSASDALRDAVRRQRPDLIIAPMLTTAIPRDVWSAHTCLIVHPGPPGDRGPSSLDWAIHEDATAWGVTVLQANDVMDGGDIWATAPCPLPRTGKSDLYRNEITDAAITALTTAVDRFSSGRHTPRPQHGPTWRTADHTRPRRTQDHRRIDWNHDTSEHILRQLRAADSRPGVLDDLLGQGWFLHGGHPEDELRGTPGQLLATRAGALCRATVDGAVWIERLRPRRRPGGPPTYPLPATLALGDALPALPDSPPPLEPRPGRRTFTDIVYREDGPVGQLRFSFPGGAMSTGQCLRLRAAYRHALTRPTSVLVLGPRRDVFSHGIHLNVIEAAPDPAQESWANLNALNDLVADVLTTTDRLVVAAVPGNAAAGGVMLAAAADEVWCRHGAVLNPHYRLMGLYGSEYWTYTLPRRVGAATARHLTRRALPMTATAARDIGLADQVIDASPGAFAARVGHLAHTLARGPGLDERIARKKAAHEHSESVKPLHAYRAEELAVMRRIFFDPQAPYHRLRSAFVHKEPAVPPGPALLPPP
ncbi:enoyl-CoA hydratase-related protein [Streptomyces sp. NPDC057638]|uniref:enoyl-CoA hydratase-related protein n=1 Tax=Streptomyces sp. NPDC057638 TaxID=3346190 RepID=UPI00368452DD